VEETVVPKPEPEKPPVVKSEAPSAVPEAVQSAPKTNVSLPVESQPVAPPRENLLERYGQKLKQFLNLQVSKIVGWFRTPPPKAIPTGFSISGNAGTAGVGTGIITLSWDHDGGGVLTTQTDTEGNFSFSNLVPGKYSVMPLLTGEYFVPPFRDVVVVDSDVTHVDFVDPPITNRWTGVQVNGAAVRK
jgi:hypothetical protein